MSEATEEKSPQSAGNKESIRFTDIIPALTGTAGFFIAMMWIAGRMYASHYFAAMNIASYQVNFSIWEYAEVGWLPGLVYVLLATLAASLSGLTILFILKLVQTSWSTLKPGSPKKSKFLSWMGKILSRVWQWLKQFFSQSFTAYLSVIFLSAILVASFGYVIWTTLEFIGKFGEANGRSAILYNAPQLDLVSEYPLDLGPAKMLSVSSSNGVSSAFIYQGFRLLTYNNGKYYFFKEIDPVTCKPMQVYIVDEKQLLQVNQMPPASIASQCKSALTQTPVPQSGTSPIPTIAP